MMQYQLNDDEIRDYLHRTATTIDKARYFVSTLADGFVRIPRSSEARTDLIDSGLRIQATLADELDSMRRLLEKSF